MFDKSSRVFIDEKRIRYVVLREITNPSCVEVMYLDREFVKSGVITLDKHYSHDQIGSYLQLPRNLKQANLFQ